MRKIATNCLPFIYSFIILSLNSSFPQVKFAVIGDYGDKFSPHSLAVANMVNRWDVDFILTLGENTTRSDIDGDVGQLYHQWIYPYIGSYGNGSPDSINRFFPTMGNHDYYIPPYGLGPQAYIDYFDSALTPYSASSGNIRYYNVRWSDDVEIFILNNYNGWQADWEDGGTIGEPDGVDSTSIQAQWLQTEMAASTANWKIVAVHGPPYTSNGNCQDEFPFTWSRWDYKGMHADAVLSAHYGTYERLEINGLLYIVNGVGGHKLGCFGNINLNSQFRENTYFGAQRIEINSGHISFNFYNENGELKDSISIDKILPIELTSFTSSIIGNVVNLNWETATEVNNYGFEVLRQTQDDKQWTNIGFVNGNGNSNSPKYYSFEDKNVVNGKYSYRLKQIDTDGKYEYSKVIEVDLGTPKEYSLLQNFPNPFNPSTKIKFRLPEKQMVSLRVFNMLGEMVKNLIHEEREAGTYTVAFDGSGLPSGIYMYRLETANYIANRKMVLVK